MEDPTLSIIKLALFSIPAVFFMTVAIFEWLSPGLLIVRQPKSEPG